ncbi:MAG: 4-(cytidine 5'-diphospho)-2-C-methyl-D-erythritol kinase [Candidatus Riflebacteria bacterium]|nr:4-(cytidine 5'-diphospho)-2-C-methyl-D-erythritol kinase [Candidatus Riflebacteria bacterium]
MKKTLIVQAHAKINVGLWVKERRPDGYHEIASLMQSISLADTITIHEVKEPGLRIECSHPLVPLGPDNLVHKAAKIVLEHFRLPANHLFQIGKAIPVAAGLAGGSSDAAAAMLGLVRMYDQPITVPQLMDLALKVGSDVPFVLHGGLALATGRGENLVFHDPPRPPLSVVVAVPKGVQVSTKWAYENYQPGQNPRKEEMFSQILPALRGRRLADLRQVVFNDLESVTLHRHPEVAELKDRLASTGSGVVLMSGSGPAVFGLFEERKAAALAASHLDQTRFDVFLEHTVRATGK